MPSDDPLKNGNLKPFEKVFRWSRCRALLTTSLASFVVLCGATSLTIHDWTTKAHIDILASGSDFEQLAGRVVEQETADAGLSKHVSAAKANSGVIKNFHIANHELNAIRESLKFTIAKRPDRQLYRLNIQFDGVGSEDEKLLVGKMSHSIAAQLNNSLASNVTAQRFQHQYAAIGESLDRNSFARHSELNAANGMVNQLNAGLSEMHSEIESLGRIRSRQDTDGKVVADNAKTDAVASAGAAPMRVVNTSLPENDMGVDRVLNSLNGLDTDSIQAQIRQIQQKLRTDAVQTRKDVSSLKSLSEDLADNRIEVDGIAPVRTRPADAAPGLGSVLLISVLAVVLGTTISQFYRPELVAVGFETVEEVTQCLGLPVAATLGFQSAGAAIRPDQTGGAANMIVRYCEIGLFAFAMLVVILCYLQAELRTAFFESPFYGLAKLAEIFFG